MNKNSNIANENGRKNATPQQKHAQEKEDFIDVHKFLIKNANEIQQLATQQHKEFLGSKRIRSELINKYQKNYIKVVEEFANNLKLKDIKKGLVTFRKL